MSNQELQLNIAICDDDPVMAQKLQDLCSRILMDRYSLSYLVSQTPRELLTSQMVFSIALLDVHLLEISGIELAREILQRNPNCRILFVSGYVHVVSDVYDVPHFCFILKDQLDSKLPKFLLRAAEMSAQDAEAEISVKTGRDIALLPLNQIVLLERRGHWTYITMADQSVHQVREKLNSLNTRMGNTDFVRCHISYVVNLRYVQSMTKRTLTLKNGALVPISLPHEQEVRNAFFLRMKN